MSHRLQHDFAAALIDAARPIPAGVVAHGGGTAAKRFAVYRNNVVAGLVNALRTRFPVIEAILGAECFAATARLFATTQPPRSPLMLLYGDAFPDFLAGFAPLAGLPYLADVARLEAARTRAYHAADAAPFDPAALRTLPADVLMHLRLGLHPSLQMLRSRHPIVTIWAMNSGEMPLAPVEEDAPEDALVIRSDGAVRVQRLPVGAAAFMQALAQETLGRAVAMALAQHRGFNVPAGLAVLIGCGAITELHPQEPSP
jgi:hypothetical protein